jgi:hypothetical protein
MNDFEAAAHENEPIICQVGNRTDKTWSESIPSRNVIGMERPDTKALLEVEIRRRDDRK